MLSESILLTEHSKEESIVANLPKEMGQIVKTVMVIKKNRRHMILMLIIMDKQLALVFVEGDVALLQRAIVGDAIDLNPGQGKEESELSSEGYE